MAVLAAATRLERLDLSDNHITTFPSTLTAALPTLWHLDLCDNRIADVDWSALSGEATIRLTTCLLSGNPFLASMPSQALGGGNNFDALTTYAADLAESGHLWWRRGRVVVVSTQGGAAAATELQFALTGMSLKTARQGPVVVVGDVKTARSKGVDKFDIADARVCLCADDVGTHGATTDEIEVEVFAVDSIGAEVRHAL